MGMIALIPTEDDLDRLALEGGEERDRLHLTLFYLGEDLSEEDAGRVLSAFKNELDTNGLGDMIVGDAFGAAVWNPNGDDPCTVLNVGGEELQPFRAVAQHLLEHNAEFAFPEQHAPWSPHICLAYDPSRVPDAVTRTGSVTFDRVRVALDDHGTTDLQLGEESTTMPWHKVNGHSECPSSQPWAVVKDSDGSVVGCHANEADANAQLAALNANEGDAEVQAEPTAAAEVVEAAVEAVEEAAVIIEAETEAPTEDEEVPVEFEAGDEGAWNGVLAIEGVRTGDGRKFANDSLVWRDLPLSLYWQRRTADGHDESVIVGNIQQIWRDGDKIRGRGRFNLTAPEGGQSFMDAHDAFQLVRDGFMRGVSVTLDDINDNDVEFIWPDQEEGDGEADGFEALFMEPEEIIFHHGRILDATLTGQPALQEAFVQIETPENAVMPPQEPEFGVVWSHTTGTIDTPWDLPAVTQRIPNRVAPALARAIFGVVGQDMGSGVLKSDCKFLHHDVSEDGVPGPANLTACVAAIAVLNGSRGGSNLSDVDRRGVYDHLASHLADAGRDAPSLSSYEDAQEFAAVTASLNVPVAPPKVWFENPGFDEITPLMVGDDGWVRGHLAKWGTCHTSFGNTCITPPPEDEFSYFTTGDLVTREGVHVPVGQLTLGTGHAPSNLSARPAAVHYDHTGFAVADVSCGADAHGIWVAGALCPDVDDITIRRLRASALSGDWRRIGGHLRLVAALVVNVPGFPIPRVRSHVHDGDQAALVAAGVVANEIVRSENTEKFRKIKDRIAASIGRDPASRARELHARVHGKVGV